MGVIYKLTDDVVAFILSQKQATPNLSCRELVDLVSEKFAVDVSKSSVHEVLKEANISSPRGRKYKNKFQIPDDKKAQIIKSLPLAMSATIPLPASVPVKEPANFEPQTMPPQAVAVAADEPIALRPDPMAIEPKQASYVLPPLKEETETLDAREFFVQAAFYDLFPLPWGQIKCAADINNIDPDMLAKEKAYRTTAIAAYKLELSDGENIFLDARFKTLSKDFKPAMPLATMEGGIVWTADQIINNLKPLVIGNIPGGFCDALCVDFIKAMNNSLDKRLKSVALLNPAQETEVEFSPIVSIKRSFIAGVDVHNKDIVDGTPINPQSIQHASTYASQSPVTFSVKSITLAGFECQAIFLLGEGQTIKQCIITNMLKSPIALVIDLYLRSNTAGMKVLPQEQVKGEENFIVAHARNLFGLGIFSNDSKPAMLEQGYNASVRIVTTIDANGYEENNVSKEALICLNNLNIIDHEGRKIFTRL